LNDEGRSANEGQNVVRVGDELEKALNTAGIVTLHDKTIHDEPYTGAYDRSASTIKNYLKQYPSIDVVLDIHRDAITYDSGEKIKPIVEINEKKAAQIMICAGCQDKGVTDYPDWKINLRFALRLQQALETTYPGLARPLYFCPKNYNQNLSHGALLIEMGSEGNTLEEAVYSGRLLGNILVKVLEDLQ
jgi:stage II sporulation protein P